MVFFVHEVAAKVVDAKLIAITGAARVENVPDGSNAKGGDRH